MATPPKTESSPLVVSLTGPVTERLLHLPVRYSWLPRRSHAVRATVALCLLSLCGKCVGDAAFITTMPAVRDATGRSEVVTVLPVLGTVVYALGKVLVFFSSNVRGRSLIVVFGSTSAICLLTFTHGSYAAMLLSWLVFRLISSQAWPCFSLLVANWVDASLVGQVSGLLNLAWEVGTGGAEFLFGLMLDASGKGRWRWPFYVASAYCAAVVLVDACMLHESAADAGYRPPLLNTLVLKAGSGPTHPLQDASVREALRYFFASTHFWLILATNACFSAAIYSAYFMNVFAVDALGATDFEASFGLSLFSLGVVTALAGLILVYDRMSAFQRFVTTVSNAVVCVHAAFAGLVLHSRGGMSLSALYAVVFVLGASGALALTMPLGIFTVTFGGPRHTPTLANVLDVASITLSALAAYSAGAFCDRGDFELLWQQICGCTLLGAIALSAYAWHDLRSADPVVLVQPAQGTYTPIK